MVPSILPAYAFIADTSAAQGAIALPIVDNVETQHITVASTEATPNVRDGYQVTSKSLPPAFAGSASSAYSRVSGTFTNDPTSAVQWPFTQGVPISSNFGPRNVTGCGFCSTFHTGLDLTPGSGTPIQAIAEGIVVETGNPRGAYGVYLVIEHNIDGQIVHSAYAHMLSGSVNLSVGDSVTVGQIVGAVGNTGASTGPHLHFEIRLDGTIPVDPFGWLVTKVGA